jgi:hypothetical protein
LQNGHLEEASSVERTVEQHEETLVQDVGPEVDFMKQVRPKFTDKTEFVDIYMSVTFTFNSFEASYNQRLFLMRRKSLRLVFGCK